MLSAKYQIFLLLLLNKALTKNKVKLFSTNKSFYTMTAFLQQKELVEAEVIDDRRTKSYSLSMRGEILAMALENILTPSEVKEIKKYIKSEVS